MSRGYLLLVVPALLTGAVPAMPADNARPPYASVQITRMSAAPMPVPGGMATVGTKEQRLAVGFGRLLARGWTFDFGLDYGYTRYEYTGIDGRNRDLHRLQIPMRAQAAANGWQFDAHVAPGISTSSNVFQDPFGRWTSDDVVLTAALEARRPASGSLSWLLGLAYDRAWGRPRAYPVAGVELAPASDLRLRLAFPDSSLDYDMSPAHALSWRVYPSGHQWRVVSDELAAEFDYRVQAVRTELTWSWRYTRGVVLGVTAGYESRTRHRFVDDTGTRIAGDAAGRWLFGISLRSGRAPLPHAHNYGW